MKDIIKSVIAAVGVAGAVALHADAAEKTWKGGSSGEWFEASNWYPAGAPSASDVVTFNGSATVNVNQPGDAELWCFVVNAGEVRIIGVDGARLVMKSDTAGSGVNGWNVKKGAKLDVRVSTLCDNRTDKWYGGELWFHAPLDLKSIAFFGYGTNVFAQGSSVKVADTLFVGLGKSDTGLRDCVIFTDNATFSGYKISFTGSDNCSSNALEIDGDDVSVTVDYLNLNGYSMTDDQYLFLKRGRLFVGNELKTEDSAAVSAGHVLQTGGELVVVNAFHCYKGTVRVEGGTFNRCCADLDFAEDTFLDLAGGEYCLSYLGTAADKTFVLDEKIHVSGEQAGFLIPGGCTMYWDFDNAVIEDRTKIVKRGLGDLLFAKSQAVSRPLDVRIGTATVASGVTLTAPAGSDAAWPLLVADTASFHLADITSRLSLPIDVSVLGDGADSGKFVFPAGDVTARGLVVARSLKVNNEIQPKGRYSAGTSAFVSGAVGSSLVVPYRWTGAGDDESFADADNWEGDVVPPSGTSTAVDLSDATRVAIDGDCTLTSVVFLPTGRNKKVTLAASGTLALDSPVAYACAAYVKEDAHLALEAAKIGRGSTSTGDMSILGGGTVSVKGDFPSYLGICGAINYLPFSIDGTLAFNGKTDIYPCDQSSINLSIFSLWGHEREGRGRVLIEDGADISAFRLFMSPDGLDGLAEIRQTGGTATFGDIYLEKTDDDDVKVEYVLEGGTLNVADRPFNLSGAYSDYIGPKRRPGPSFRMTGGTLNVPQGFAIDGNQNRVRLYGGTVNGAKTWRAEKTGDEYGGPAVWDPNTDIFYFGGVTLADTATSEADRLIIASDTILTGIGGDTVFTVGDHWTVLGQPGVNISGPGGVVANSDSGSALFWVRGNLTFTGGITANTAYRCYIGNGCAGETINGPRFIKVTKPSCLLIIMGKVEKAPEVISVPAWNDYELSGQFILADYAVGDLSVKRFIVGGQDRAPGRYAVGGGYVVVQPRDTSWLDGDKGDLTYVGDSTVADAVTLSSLRYAPFEIGQAATLSGSVPVTLTDGAVIDVSEGQTLVITAPFVFSGKVRKTGFGKVVFAGPVSGDAGSIEVEGGALDVRDVFASSIAVMVRENASLCGTVAVGSAVTFADGSCIESFGGQTFGLAGQVAVNGKVKVVGAGTVDFTGAVTGIVGTVEVASGTLKANGSLAETIDVTVAEGAFLAGDGVIGGNVTLADGAGLAMTVKAAKPLEVCGALTLGDTGVFRVDDDGASVRKRVFVTAGGTLDAPQDFAGWSQTGSAEGVCIIRDGNSLLLKRNSGFVIVVR